MSDLGEFHWKDGVSFQRVDHPHDAIRLRAAEREWIIPMNEWVSVIAALRSGQQRTPDRTDYGAAWAFMAGDRESS